MAPRSIILLFFILLSSSRIQYFSVAQSWIKAGYWYFQGEFPVSQIDSSLFTHLIYGFANVNSSTYQLSIPSAEDRTVSSFTDVVRRRNPSVKTLLSIWNGQNSTSQSISGDKVGSSVLSSALRDSSNRKRLIESSIETARLYGFQGIDLFWLWPNSTDLSDVGVLLDEWRAAVTSETRNSNDQPQLMLTMAVHRLPTREAASYPIDSMKRNLDWAHVVAYDYHLPSWENVTGAHAALYDPCSNISTDFGIREWLRRGFPPNKLVLGLPYHGYAWRLVNPKENAVASPASGPAITIDGSVGYKFVKRFIEDYGNGAAPVYNATYVVNFFTTGSIWINFDGVEVIKAKISYSKEMKLLGYNAFVLGNDEILAVADEDNQKNKLKILLPVALVSVLIASTVYYFGRRAIKSKGTNTSAAENGGTDAPSPQIFSFSDIKVATNNFSSENKLGQGGYGPVYKGKLLPSGHEIAVKRLSATSTQGLEEFKSEVSLTARLQHVNLLRVLGYCSEKCEKMLIYEYMPNKSLDLYLFDPTGRSTLDWQKLVNIIEGVIQGLLYLQEYSNFTIIHRDIKASNILLDNQMNPKISDFGMAKLFGKDISEANTNRIVGTFGYAPPEYVRNGTYSMKYDVYSFGVLLLQIISGKKNAHCYGSNENLNLLEYAYEQWKGNRGMKCIDPTLDDSSSPCKLLRCLQVALLCVQENPVDRPSMLEVSLMLKSDAMANIADPKRPAFTIKSDENLGNGSTPRVGGIYSSNDAQLSELEPR